MGSGGRGRGGRGLPQQSLLTKQSAPLTQQLARVTTNNPFDGRTEKHALSQVDNDETPGGNHDNISSDKWIKVVNKGRKKRQPLDDDDNLVKNKGKNQSPKKTIGFAHKERITNFVVPSIPTKTLIDVDQLFQSHKLLTPNGSPRILHWSIRTVITEKEEGPERQKAIRRAIDRFMGTVLAVDRTALLVPYENEDGKGIPHLSSTEEMRRLYHNKGNYEGDNADMETENQQNDIGTYCSSWVLTTSKYDLTKINLRVLTRSSKKEKG